MNEGKAIGWADEVEGNEGFTLLPAGTKVDFIVKDIEKAEDKKYKCNIAILVLSCTSPKGSTTIKERLTMYTDFLWKINQFFTCIGLREPGAPTYKMEWGKVKGASGTAIVTVRKWKNDDGKEMEFNNIERFLPHVSFVGSEPEAPTPDNNVPF